MEKREPIQRSKAFVQFSKDHHFGLLLIWKIRKDLTQQTGTEEIARYVNDFFREDLAPHFKEEEIIYNRLSADDPLCHRAESEHRQIYDIIGAIQQDSTNAKLLHRFADLLEAHIRFEERTLFNHLQEQPGQEDLNQLIVHTARSHKLFARNK